MEAKKETRWERAKPFFKAFFGRLAMYALGLGIMLGVVFVVSMISVIYSVHLSELAKIGVDVVAIVTGIGVAEYVANRWAWLN